MGPGVRAACAALAVGLAGMTDAGAETTVRLLDYSELEGWADDDHGAALTVFLNTCMDMDEGEWPALCALAQSGDVAPRQFFELFFRPVLIGGDSRALFTG